ncbi:hypothetical protein Tsubulata_039681 [Turnera subulata]|uniref:F-box domain-containing protein n=1 Tax=Turnera subulata TaxID=218843 RepID=A0A9Q0FPC9_9ROSI|nr:hypothetical protein Tsubulata_039681 [Turnera subulata]
MSVASNKRKREENSDETDMKIRQESCLPSVIVEEILALLPNKPIHRFRIVSKSWLSLLASVDFHKLRCKSAPPAINVPKLLEYKEKFSVFNSLEYGSNGEIAVTKVWYPLDDLVSVNPFVGSCNGLVCLQYELLIDNSNIKRKREIVVWNPFTGSYRKLPDIPVHGWTYTYGFGYDSASDDYKVFIATGHNHYPVPGDGARVDIFSLKTGSWRKMKKLDDRYLRCIQPEHEGLFLNGALHWESRGNGSFYDDKKIFAFDLSTEKFYDVPKSNNPDCRYGYQSLGVVGEYLCLCFSSYNNELRNIVWVMKEYCNEASWVHFISYMLFSLLLYW